MSLFNSTIFPPLLLVYCIEPPCFIMLFLMKDIFDWCKTVLSYIFTLRICVYCKIIQNTLRPRYPTGRIPTHEKAAFTLPARSVIRPKRSDTGADSFCSGIRPNSVSGQTRYSAMFASVSGQASCQPRYPTKKYGRIVAFVSSDRIPGSKCN